MSKGSGMGQKRDGSRNNKGMDKCDASSHSKQCGRAKKVSKGSKQWMSPEAEIDSFQADIFIPEEEDYLSLNFFENQRSIVPAEPE